jgi:hypothetical protein
MKLVLFSVFVLVLAFAAGCKKDESDLTKEDRVKMDKLFREGIKNPPSGEQAKEGQPLNAPTD